MECESCGKEMTFIPDVNLDIELDSGAYVCKNNGCEKYLDEILITGRDDLYED